MGRRDHDDGALIFLVPLELNSRHRPTVTYVAPKAAGAYRKLHAYRPPFSRATNLSFDAQRRPLRRCGHCVPRGLGVPRGLVSQGAVWPCSSADRWLFDVRWRALARAPQGEGCESLYRRFVFPRPVPPSALILKSGRQPAFRRIGSGVAFEYAMCNSAEGS